MEATTQTFRGILHNIAVKVLARKQLPEREVAYRFDIRNRLTMNQMFVIEEGHFEEDYHFSSPRFVHHPLRDYTMLCSRDEWLRLSKESYETIRAVFQEMKDKQTA